MDSFQRLAAALSSCDVTLNKRQRKQISIYLSLLRKWQGHYNLTSVADGDELLRFHFLEACWAASVFLPSRWAVADVGSGAGFPGLVMKLYKPRLCVSLIEKNFNKSVFLTQVAQELSLKVNVFTGLAEEFSDWDRIDAAVIRALRPSPELLNLLQGKRVRLLIFHGQEIPSLCAWRLERRERFPLSRNRWAALYRPRLDT